MPVRTVSHMHRCFPPCPSRPISSIATTICPGRRHLRAEPHCILYCLSSVLWCASTKSSFRRGSAAREPAHRQSSLAIRAAVWEHRTCASNSKIGSLGRNKSSRNRPKPWATEFSSSTPSPSAALTPKSASPLFFSIIFFCLSTATPPRHLHTYLGIRRTLSPPPAPQAALVLAALPAIDRVGPALECNDMWLLKINRHAAASSISPSLWMSSSLKEEIWTENGAHGQVPRPRSPV